MDIQLENKIQNLFESIKKIDENGQEYWLARELMPILDYNKWDNFHGIIEKAKESLQKTYPQTSDHFAEASKKIKIAAGTDKEATREVLDFKLTRYACYLIAQNGDPKKEAIAFAQSYFAIQTRKQEIQNEKSLHVQRIMARKKLTETEKEFSGVLSDHGVDSRGIAEIRSAGDAALFNKDTREMKKLLNAGKGRPLADYIPTITLKAKDLATEMTTFQTKSKSLIGKDPIKAEHVHNNQEVRAVLNNNGIFPEILPPEEDIKKLERRIGQDEVKKLKTNDFSELSELIIDISSVKDRKQLKQIHEIINVNPGDTTLKIMYGDPYNLKMIVKNLQVNTYTINELKPYIVM